MSSTKEGNEVIAGGVGRKGGRGGGGIGALGDLGEEGRRTMDCCF